MIHSAQPSHNTPGQDGRGLSVPQTLAVEREFIEKLHRHAQRGEWADLGATLVALKNSRMQLGWAAVAAIVNTPSIEERASLLNLVCGRQASVVLTKLLLELGADPNNAFFKGVGLPTKSEFEVYPPPLFSAIASGDFTVMKRLLSRGADPNARNGNGETPLQAVMVSRPILVQSDNMSPSVWQSYAKALIEAGADPSIPDRVGETLLFKSLVQNRWDEALFWVNQEGKIGTLLVVQRDLLVSALKRRFHRPLKTVDTPKVHGELTWASSGTGGLSPADAHIRDALKWLRKLRPAVGQEIVSEVLNSPRSGGQGVSIFGAMLVAPESLMALYQAMRLGGSLHAIFSVTMVGLALRDARAIHLAVLSGKPEIANFVLRTMGSAESNRVTGTLKFTPLHLAYLAKTDTGRAEIIRNLLDYGADPHVRTADGLSLFNRAVMSRDAEGASLWAEYEVNPFVDSHGSLHQMIIDSRDNRERKRKLMEVARLRMSLPSDIEDEMLRFAGHERQTLELSALARKYIKAFQISQSHREWARARTEMYELLPHAMLTRDPTALSEFISQIDLLYDTSQPIRNFHPFEAELMALLAHPRTAEKKAAELQRELETFLRELNSREKNSDYLRDGLQNLIGKLSASNDKAKSLREALFQISQLPDIGDGRAEVIAAELERVFTDVFTGRQKPEALDAELKRILSPRWRDDSIARATQDDIRNLVANAIFGGQSYHSARADLWLYVGLPASPATKSDFIREKFNELIAQDQAQLLADLVLALTSINRFIDQGVQDVSRDVVTLWARIGVLSFSFRYWKWDTHGVALNDNRGLSLFEQFGFEPLQLATFEAGRCGPGFSLPHERKRQIQRELERRGKVTEFNSEVEIQFRRGFLLASHPEHGTLIIRNSSPIFGRSLLKHPCYYSRFSNKYGFGAGTTRTLTPAVIEQSFDRILEPSLYAGEHLSVAHIDYLLRHIELVREHYAAWKFDTRVETAWETVEGIGKVLQGAQWSDGYSAVVQQLSRLSLEALKKKNKAHQLAFFDPKLPAWVPIFFTDLDGKEHSSLQLNADTLLLLKKYETSSVSRTDYEADRGRVHGFLQAGIKACAELVIIDSDHTE